MPINPNIALAVKGIELQDPLTQYGRVAAIQQAQQQNALANMQMQEYSRAREEEQGIRNRLAGGASLEDAGTRNYLIGSKTGRDILQRQSDLSKAQTEEDARRAKLMADTEGMYRNMSGQISNKADAAAFLQRMVNDPALKGSPIASIPLMQQIQRIPDDPQGLDNWVKQFALGTTKYITENKPVTQQINRMGQTDIVRLPGLGGTPTTVGTYADVPLPAAVKAMGGGGSTRAAAPAAPAAPVGKPMTQLQQQAQRKLMAADKTSVKNSQNVVGELEKLTDELVGNPEKGIRPDPGLSGITGFQALIPSMPKSDARKAQQKLETMKGKVMAFGRQLASLEGKLGNMAVQEWKFVSDSIQALDPAAGNLDVQLRDIVRQAKNFANTVQERYDLTYEGGEEMPSAAPSRPSAPAPAAGAGGGLSPAEQAELDQLRARFGKK